MALPRRSDPHSVGREGFVAPAFDITRVPFFPPLWLFPGQIANPPVPGRENFLPPAGGFTLYFGFSGVKSTIVTVFGSGLKAHSRLSHTLNARSLLSRLFGFLQGKFKITLFLNEKTLFHKTMGFPCILVLVAIRALYLWFFGWD